MPPSPEERQLLRERGAAALQALLGAVSDQLLLYIAPDCLPGQVQALLEAHHGIFCGTSTKYSCCDKLSCPSCTCVSVCSLGAFK